MWHQKTIHYSLHPPFSNPIAAKRAFEMQAPKRLPGCCTRRKQSRFFLRGLAAGLAASKVSEASVTTGTGTPKLAGGRGPSIGKPRVARWALMRRQYSTDRKEKRV